MADCLCISPVETPQDPDMLFLSATLADRVASTVIKSSKRACSHISSKCDELRSLSL